MDAGAWLPPQHHAADYQPGTLIYVRNPYPTTDKTHYTRPLGAKTVAAGGFRHSAPKS